MPLSVSSDFRNRTLRAALDRSIQAALGRDAARGTGRPTTRRHVITFLSRARQQRIIHDVAIPEVSTGGVQALPAGN